MDLRVERSSEFVASHAVKRAFAGAYRTLLPITVWLSLGNSACSSAAAAATSTTTPHLVTPSPPPKDDGQAAQGGDGGDTHAAALEQLRTATIGTRGDKQNSVMIPLPDASNWTRVRFLTLPSLVGFRYGKAHHAIVAAFVTHVDDNTELNACNKSFETWAMPFVEAFEVDLKHESPSAFAWAITPSKPPPGASIPKKIAIVDVDPLFAKTATVLSRENYAAAWAAYPAWEKACLIVGVAVPVRDDEPRARDVRDRFIKDTLPHVIVPAGPEPKERF